MPRCLWHVEDGLGAFLPPGSISAHADGSTSYEFEIEVMICADDRGLGPTLPPRSQLAVPMTRFPRP
jgi:hypothetical protein